ncbi:hypothetical protein JNL27_18355 [bacterium]|nr:hypothetical protein [bacterium]
MILTTDAGHGKLNFSVWAGYDMSAVIVMYDLQGKKVAQMPGDFVKGVNEFSLKAGAKLASGNYIIKISSVKAGQLSLLNASKKFLYTE